mmetsp:Transcript_1753/g.3313  ORF Transcript_1753/g.3313 Transcript_1753/m.3313 type:complete len:322 (+) Transcript_1753:245-1210(+)
MQRPAALKIVVPPTANNCPNGQVSSSKATPRLTSKFARKRCAGIANPHRRSTSCREAVEMRSSVHGTFAKCERCPSLTTALSSCRWRGASFNSASNHIAALASQHPSSHVSWQATTALSSITCSTSAPLFCRISTSLGESGIVKGAAPQPRTETMSAASSFRPLRGRPRHKVTCTCASCGARFAFSGRVLARLLARLLLLLLLLPKPEAITHQRRSKNSAPVAGSMGQCRTTSGPHPLMGYTFSPMTQPSDAEIDGSAEAPTRVVSVVSLLPPATCTTRGLGTSSVAISSCGFPAPTIAFHNCGTDSGESLVHTASALLRE